jgi:NTP pyrophosphatase (non-canonical NTP hydrolase)
MEDTGELGSASRVYEAQLERTVQELNRRRGELEDALHQVSFMAISSYDSFAKFINS